MGEFEKERRACEQAAGRNSSQEMKSDPLDTRFEKCWSDTEGSIERWKEKALRGERREEAEEVEGFEMDNLDENHTREVRKDTYVFHDTTHIHDAGSFSRLFQAQQGGRVTQP